MALMNNQGVCPVCNGLGRIPCTDDSLRHHNTWRDYHAKSDTVLCDNCGAQYQNGKPTGKVNLRPDGTPCQHEYKSTAGRWNCTTIFTCIHCGESHMFDSGD